VDVGSIVALVGLVLTAIGLIVSVRAFTRRLRDSELREAEERGKMAQRLAEAEEDIDKIGTKVSATDTNVATLQQAVAAMVEGQKHISGQLDTVIRRINQHMDTH
jgi:hypothetical protein